ncbi:MAG TPA: hypothetical protein VLF43_01145 [Candidatus Saccharimonadales bacterium]|nr:hypothetical protein [Candidatus Saccharimonadales bacterium]
MAFEIWDIPGGQWAEGANETTAIYSAIGEAAVNNRLFINQLQAGSHDLTVTEIQLETHEQAGIAVIDPHRAFCYSGVPPAKHVRGGPVVRRHNEPHLRIMPDDMPHFPLFLSREAGKFMRVQLFSFVRYVEGTDSLSQIVARRLQK